MQYLLPSKINPSFTSFTTKIFKLSSFGLLILAVGFLAAPVVMAESVSLQVASMDNPYNRSRLNNNKTPILMARGNTEAGIDCEIETDTQLGAFSREDGAMMGAYGDGDYEINE